jgi:hypothetical protein
MSALYIVIYLVISICPRFRPSVLWQVAHNKSKQNLQWKCKHSFFPFYFTYYFLSLKFCSQYIYIFLFLYNYSNEIPYNESLSRTGRSLCEGYFMIYVSFVIFCFVFIFIQFQFFFTLTTTILLYIYIIWNK